MNNEFDIFHGIISFSILYNGCFARAIWKSFLLSIYTANQSRKIFLTHHLVKRAIFQIDKNVIHIMMWWREHNMIEHVDVLGKFNFPNFDWQLKEPMLVGGSVKMNKDSKRKIGKRITFSILCVFLYTFLSSLFYIFWIIWVEKQFFFAYPVFLITELFFFLLPFNKAMSRASAIRMDFFFIYYVHLVILNSSPPRRFIVSVTVLLCCVGLGMQQHYKILYLDSRI